MKISRINITNFLGLESLTMDLQAPINVIAGPNEAGKSSIRDALQWCLTGQARGLKTHHEQAALIRNGQKAAEVTITFADGKTIARRKTPKSPATVTGEVVEGAVPLAIFCDPYIYLGLPEDQRREMLFKVIPGLSPGRKDIAAKLRAHIADPGFSVADLASLAASKGFKAAETEAVAGRREAKRLRDSLKVEFPEKQTTIGEVVYVLPDIDEADVKRGLAELQSKRDALLTAKGRTEAAREQAAELEEELISLEANLPQPPDENEAKELEEAVRVNQDILDKIRSDLAELEPKPAPVPQVFPANCPAVKVAHPCPLAGQTASPAQEAPPLPDPEKLGNLRLNLQDQAEQVEALKKDLADVQTAAKLYQDAQERITRIKADLDSLRETASQETPAGLDEEISRLEERITTGQTLLTRVKEFWLKQNQAETAAKNLAKVDQEVTIYDALAKAMAPDGIPSQMIAEALGPVNALLSVAAGYLFPGRDLVMTEELGIDLSGSPYITLSKSAKYRVGIAFQYALAKLAKARLLLIDEADILDPPNRAKIIEFLLSVKDDFDTVMVFSTSNQVHPSPVAEMQTWWIEDGRLSPVNQQQAA